MMPRRAVAILVLLVACSSGAAATQSPSDGYPKIDGVGPSGLAIADDGTLWVADCVAHRIYRVDPSGEVTSYGVGDKKGVASDFFEFIVGDETTIHALPDQNAPEAFVCMGRNG